MENVLMNLKSVNKEWNLDTKHKVRGEKKIESKEMYSIYQALWLIHGIYSQLITD